MSQPSSSSGSSFTGTSSTDASLNGSPSTFTPFSVSVPGTIANLGPGFDSFGLAIDWRNRFSFVPADATQDTVETLTPSETSIHGGPNAIPLCPKDNMVFQALDRLYALQAVQRPALTLGIHMVYHAHASHHVSLPLARGLGSSSTAIVAGLMAGNHLLGNPLSLDDLCRLATEMEGHPDNVVPALRGGVLLCDETRAYPLPWPQGWEIALVIPEYPILTEDARRVLPVHPTREDAIFNLRKASLLTYALLKANPEAFRQSLADRLHQPYRAALIPEFEPLVDLTLHYGGLGCIISGSGSTLAVFYQAEQAEQLIPALEGFVQSRSGIRLMRPAVSRSGSVIEPFERFSS